MTLETQGPLVTGITLNLFVHLEVIIWSPYVTLFMVHLFLILTNRRSVPFIIQPLLFLVGSLVLMNLQISVWGY